MVLSYIWNVSHHILSPSSVVFVECGRRPTNPNTLAALAAAEQRRQQLHSTREDRRARAWERTSDQHLAQHLDQQSQPGNATQQAQEAASQSEVVALNNRMELRRSEEQFRRIAAPLNCSLT